MPDPITGTIAAGGTILSGVIGSKGSSKAANTQAASADRAAELQAQVARETNALQQRIYEETVARNEPARQMGVNALTQLSGMTTPTRPTGFETSPGYQFRLQEGQDALNRQASASGLRLSGAAMKDALSFGQGIASDEYGAWWNRERNLDDTRFNRTASVAGVGQTATGAIDAAGRGYAGAVGSTNAGMASNVGNALMAGGQARASGYQGSANAWNNALSGIGQIGGYAAAGGFGPNFGFGGGSNLAAFQPNLMNQMIAGARG